MRHFHLYKNSYKIRLVGLCYDLRALLLDYLKLVLRTIGPITKISKLVTAALSVSLRRPGATDAIEILVHKIMSAAFPISAGKDKFQRQEQEKLHLPLNIPPRDIQV